VNITPALPNPYQLPVEQDRKAVAAVRAPNPPRDVVDQAERRQPLSQTIDQAGRERIVSHADARVTPYQDGSARTSRALASYAQIAANGESGGLRELLGFDAYA
jgi:hypothetical protein